MIDGLEATNLAQFLKASRWVYPLVNAGHIFGVALLIGAIVPLDLTLAGVVRRVDRGAALRLLRPFAIAGIVLAAGTGALLFITQASDYAQSDVLRAKMALLAAALLNAALHLRAGADMPAWGAWASLLLWPAVMVMGRMIGYTIG